MFQLNRHVGKSMKKIRRIPLASATLSEEKLAAWLVLQHIMSGDNPGLAASFSTLPSAALNDAAGFVTPLQSHERTVVHQLLR